MLVFLFCGHILRRGCHSFSRYNGCMKNIPYILRAEGLAMFIAATWVYSMLAMSWWWFFLLIFVPDVFMIGYARNSKLGATIYNLGHTYIAPFIVLALFVYFNDFALLMAAVLWFAHIGMDRALGYGLKFESGFKHTHLGDIGK